MCLWTLVRATAASKFGGKVWSASLYMPSTKSSNLCARSLLIVPERSALEPRRRRQQKWDIYVPFLENGSLYVTHLPKELRLHAPSEFRIIPISENYSGICIRIRANFVIAVSEWRKGSCVQGLLGWTDLHPHISKIYAVVYFTIAYFFMLILIGIIPPQ